MVSSSKPCESHPDVSQPGGGIMLRIDWLGSVDTGLENLIERDVGAGPWPGEVSLLRGWRELGDPGNSRASSHSGDYESANVLPTS